MSLVAMCFVCPPPLIFLSPPIIVQGDRVKRSEFIAAKLMQEDFASIGASLRPILVASGNSEEEVDRWIREQVAEVREMRVKTYVKVGRYRACTLYCER